MTPRELAIKLNEHLPEPIFEELTRFLEEGDCSSLYEEMAEIDGVRYPEKYCSIPYEVEYDLNYTGGNYSGVGQLITILSPTKGHISSLFQKQTGIDPIHIIHYQVADNVDEENY